MASPIFADESDLKRPSYFVEMQVFEEEDAAQRLWVFATEANRTAGYSPDEATTHLHLIVLDNNGVASVRRVRSRIPLNTRTTIPFRIEGRVYFLYVRDEFRPGQVHELREPGFRKLSSEEWTQLKERFLESSFSDAELLKELAEKKAFRRISPPSEATLFQFPQVTSERLGYHVSIDAKNKSLTVETTKGSEIMYTTKLP